MERYSELINRLCNETLKREALGVSPIQELIHEDRLWTSGSSTPEPMEFSQIGGEWQESASTLTVERLREAKRILMENGRRNDWNPIPRPVGFPDRIDLPPGRYQYGVVSKHLEQFLNLDGKDCRTHGGLYTEGLESIELYQRICIDSSDDNYKINLAMGFAGSLKEKFVAGNISFDQLRNLLMENLVQNEVGPKGFFSQKLRPVLVKCTENKHEHAVTPNAIAKGFYFGRCQIENCKGFVKYEKTPDASRG